MHTITGWSILFVISSNILQVTQTSLVLVQLNALKTVQDEMLYQDRIYCVKTVCDQSIIRLISYKNCFDRIRTVSTQRVQIKQYKREVQILQDCRHPATKSHTIVAMHRWHEDNHNRSKPIYRTRAETHLPVES